MNGAPPAGVTSIWKLSFFPDLPLSLTVRVKVHVVVRLIMQLPLITAVVGSVIDTEVIAVLWRLRLLS